MDTRLLTALAVGGLVFLLLRRSASAGEGDLPPVVSEDRVMGYHRDIWSAGAYHNVDPAIIASVIYQESRGDPGAIGAAGEVGLMQVKISTALQFGGLLDPEMLPLPSVNIRAGTQYLRYLLDRYNGNIAASLAAYNAGPGRVEVDSATRRISAPDASKRYSIEVMGRVPRFRDRFRAVPAYSASYGVLFRTSNWFMNFDSFDGIRIGF
jgi:soluble lytic murein transglycosylase-like protein